ncbi:MAG TPA: EamA family transporter [Saprospiraceae bacterium]|nr:EamA family transporter [Saprospiraceae bacterium]
MKKDTRNAYLALLVVCVVWGVSWVGTKEAVRNMPPFQMVGIRQFLAGLVYVGYFLVRGAKLPGRKDWKIILLLSFLNFMVSNGLATWGVKLTTAGISAIIGAIFPLWLVIILTFKEGNRFPRMAWMGILLGFVGICIIFYDHLKLLFDYSFLGGIVLGLVAALSWAYGTIYTKEYAEDFNPYQSIGWQMLISGVTLNIVATVTGQTIPISEITLYTWEAILFLVVVSSIIAFLAYLYALQRLPASLVSTYAYINPIVAVFAGHFFIHEKLSLLMLEGSLVTLTGVYIVNRALTKAKKAEAL